MNQVNLPNLVKRRFIHYVNVRGSTVPQFVDGVGISPRELCKLIAGQQIHEISLLTHYHLAQWLNMSLANVLALAHIRPRITDIIRLGMEVAGYRPSNANDQLTAAHEIGISVAVFRRALYGYADFRPSIQTCDRFAQWLSWTGFGSEDIALSTGQIVYHKPDGHRTTVALPSHHSFSAYACACGRPGCVVPAHIPTGPRRKWRSDACRMWNKRQMQRQLKLTYTPRPSISPALSCPPPARFITINERLVPVRF